MYEKYANPGMYLDTDNHARLIEENKAAYLREAADRKKAKIEKITQALDVVSYDEAARLRAERKRLIAELEDLGERIEHERRR